MNQLERRPPQGAASRRSTRLIDSKDPLRPTVQTQVDFVPSPPRPADPRPQRKPNTTEGGASQRSTLLIKSKDPLRTTVQTRGVTWLSLGGGPV